MPIYILFIEYSDNYLKTTQSLQQQHKDEPYLNANNSVVGFPVDNNGRASFKFKTKIAGRTVNDGTKDVKIMISLKHLSSFSKNLEMELINCKINLILTWSTIFFVIDNPLKNKYQHLQ